MRIIELRFGRNFAPWGIALPPEDVEARRRGKIVGGGWAIWYLFGENERGGYLDYYASHHMTDDRHVHLREDGPAELLPTIATFQIESRDPGEDARIEAERRVEETERALVEEPPAARRGAYWPRSRTPCPLRPPPETAPIIPHRTGGARLGTTLLHIAKSKIFELAANRQLRHPSHPTCKAVRSVY